jgi:hypothetical protein
MTTVGPFGSAAYHLESVAEGIWKAVGSLIGGVMVFDGVGSSFRFSDNAIRSLPFKRTG